MVVDVLEKIPSFVEASVPRQPRSELSISLDRCDVAFNFFLKAENEDSEPFLGMDRFFQALSIITG